MIDRNDRLTQLTLVADGRVDGHVALVAFESFTANTAAGRVANKVVVGTLENVFFLNKWLPSTRSKQHTYLTVTHAVLAVIAFGTNCQEENVKNVKN